MSERNARLRIAIVALAALLAAVVWFVWAPVLELELLGWDSYPLIAAVREGKLFGSELMGGRYPLGHYYRPLVHASFALDHALWSLAPRGYHATDLALLVACVLAIGWLAFELFGGARERWLALVAAGLAAFEYATNPVHLDILPAAARRADSLAVLFTLLALIAQHRRKRWLAAVLVVSAMGSKETGAIAAVVVAGLALLETREQRLRALVPLGVGVALFLGVRTFVLGGIGGGRESAFAFDAARIGELALGYLSVVLGARWSGPALAFAVLGLVVLAALLLARKPRAASAELSHGPAAVLLGAWFIALVAITALSGVERGWYALPFVTLRCLAIAWLATAGARALTSGAKALGALGLVLAAWLFVTDTWLAIPEPALADLRRASALERDFLDRFEQGVKAAPGGTRITVAGFPMELASRAAPSREQQRTIAMLAPYSLDAYAELVAPGRKVRLVPAGAAAQPPAAGEVVVVLAP